MSLTDNSAPLNFWKRNNESFLLWAAIAKVYLAVIADRVPEESLFSINRYLCEWKAIVTDTI